MNRWLVAVALIVCGCAAVQKGTAAACQTLTSLDPVVGPVCLQVEEVESVIAHVLAARSMRASHPEMTKQPLDICEAHLP